MPDLKAPAHSRNACLQLCRIAFPESSWISPSAAWPVGPPLLLLPLQLPSRSPTIILAVLPRERLPLRAPISHYSKTCSSYTHSRYMSVHLLPPVHVNVPVHRLHWRSCSARAASPPTQPRRKRSVVFVYVLVRYSNRASAQHNSRGCVTVAFVPPCIHLHT